MKKLLQTILLWSLAVSANCQKIENGVLYLEEGTVKTTYAEYAKRPEITGISFPTTLTDIGYLSFNNNPGLTSITIPGTVDTIHGWAFSECENLKKVVVEDGVVSIKECAFYNSLVDTFVIPSSVVEILPWSFTSDASCVVCCEYGSAAYEFAQSEKFNIHITGFPAESRNNLRAIELVGEVGVADSLFFGYQRLEYVRLSYGIERIGSAAFQNTAITHIDLPVSISYIADDAFSNSTSCRCVAGTYAEKWLIDHGYRLCGRLSDMREYTLGDVDIADVDVPEGVSLYKWKDFDNAQAVLARWQTVDDISKYNFHINNPVDVRRVGDSLVVTSFYIRPLQNACLCVEGESPFACFDAVQPLTRIAIPAPQGVGDGPFVVTAPDSLYNVVRGIRMRDSIRFGDVKETEGVEYTWEPLSPIQAREWIYMFTNMCYIMNLPEFEQKLYSYAGMCYDDSEGKDLLYLDDLKELYQRILDKDYNQLRRCGAGAWGLGHVPGWAIGLTDWALMQHYESSDNYSAAFHEFSHNMGYGHDGNMTSGKKPIGSEDDPNAEYYGFETAAYTIFQEHLAQDRLVYNDIELLNSYDMYPQELTCISPLASRIENYGEPKANGPQLKLTEQLELTDTVTITAKLVNNGAYFSNLFRAVVYSETTNDSVASLGQQYVSLTTEQNKTKLFELANDSIVSGNYRVELQYWNSFVGEWQLPEPEDWAVLSWRWNNPLLPEDPTDVRDVEQLSVVVYPNPTTGQINVQSPHTVSEIYVYDPTGRLVLTNENGALPDLSGLADGVYQLQIVTEKGVVVKSVVKCK